ncbi:MAG TPA: AmmeMemoRadiSam system radical SAM enzyme [Candidatus Saccharimonadales bacterium]|nr:AmmeMemoRadiSam system radical SAM enzyme [Candidatus Saccharimonadales bacterium]
MPANPRSETAAAGPAARWWKPDGERVLCTLCPRYCRIGEGQSGFCFIRVNQGGELKSLGYGRPAAIQIDPIEKKPLNHFLPGTTVFSMGTAGCNMGCKFCQNWEISKSRDDQVRSVGLSPGEVVGRAIAAGCRSLAFTYNEPTIWGEYVIDISRRARAEGLKSVMVTNGYITREALPEVYEFIDAANVDLKAFTEEFYRKVTLTHLEPVLEALVELRKRNVWIEITTLLIPTLNDAIEEIREISRWILENLGDEVPLHFTAFHPDFRLMNLPPTPPATVEAARREALSMGLKYVYVGNVVSKGGSDTRCPGCGETVIRRSWHAVEEYRLDEGRCRCGVRIPGLLPGRGPSRRTTGGVIPLFH